MKAYSDEVQQILKRWSFNWGAMDVLIGGKSSIDLTDLRFRNWHDATQFLRYYGFDPDVPAHARVIHAVIAEAWSFIEKVLMPIEWKRGKRPPDKLLFADDARDIIIAASDLRPEARFHQIWACSVLRVMHTIAHIDGVQRLLDSSAACEQIMQRFREMVFEDDEGKLLFGKKSQSIDLFTIEWKTKKSRESMILKLLHKKANVAETIYDLVGVRIVTKQLCDVMVVVKFLRDFHIVTFPNCNPGRTRNSLVDVQDFKHNVEMLRRLVKNQQLAPQEFMTILEGTLKQSKSKGAIENPHSGKDYRSIQLTCRQLIRYQDRSRSWLEKLGNALHDESISDRQKSVIKEILKLSGVCSNPHRFEPTTETAGFFPFEIQIMDEDSYLTNNEGDANHKIYKKSQIRAARRRVLSQVLTY